MFGKKKPAGATVAIIDVENGSVAAALAELSRRDAPRLFAETRVPLPVPRTHSAQSLARAADRAIEEALVHVSEVSSRMRAHEAHAGPASIAHVAGFFSVPWASLNLDGKHDLTPFMQDAVRNAARATLGERKMSFHPFGTAALHGAASLFQADMPDLVCIVSGETTELLLAPGGMLKARATLPFGLNTLLRTLMSHGGVSATEARSYVNLGAPILHALGEASAHAAAHFAAEFADAARQLMRAAPARGVLVIAPAPAEAWFARALEGDEALSSIFPEGSTVRTLRASHLQPYFSGHGPRPDLPLMLEALFVDKKFGA
ncbi:MAG TPA: hypothetical protein VHD37_01095 [Candidatus Paceibacterota bacterium]|nr:hypothetical protein [Candidatus Paceibacterota bacterium]